jgi:uncharacterized protein (DUF924 family)
MLDEIESVLSFWFEPKPTTEAETGARMRFWFMGSEAVDHDIRERFSALVERARAGELDSWAESARGTLALIILIDQFSRNLYRGQKEAFSADGKALDLARAGFDSGRFDDFDVLYRIFAALPFCHAENLESQKRSVAMAQRDALVAEPVYKPLFVQGVDISRKHLDVIARFGRFPHRNAVLGRPSTAEELEYLEYLKFAGQWL